jgi:hypothetical protein
VFRQGVLAAVVLLAGCGRVFGLDAPALATDAAAVADAPPADVPSIDAGMYRASAVRFSGATYLSYGALAGVADSPRGTLSVWLRFIGNDNHQQLITAAELGVGSFGGIGGIARQANNHVEVALLSCTGVTRFDMTSMHTYTAASGWIHVLASWDGERGRAQLYINDVDDRTPGSTINNGPICYAAPSWGVGGVTAPSLDADVADLFVSLDTSLDLDSPTNRRLFISQSRKPVDLGLRCSKPLSGVVPTLCFTGTPATWATNLGTGGGFSVDGQSLVAAPDSPSD